MIAYRTSKSVLVTALACLSGLHALADLDTSLLREIKSWHKGDAPPARLIRFPDGGIELLPECGLRALGSAVEDYVSEIRDVDLLATLIFDPRARPDTLHAAVSQLIILKGVAYVSHLLTEKRKTEPSAFSRSELAVLSELLRSSYLAVQVARIEPEDMPPETAENALLAMRKNLEAGTSWAEAYRKHSDLNPDIRDRAKNPKSVRTVICYLYEGTISPTGFDIVTYRKAENLPVAHLRELFRAKQGTHVLKAVDGVYLYHIQTFYHGAN
jgi:hypothetical protein